MKRIYVQVAICTTILAVLAMPAAVAKQGRQGSLTDFDFHGALSRPNSLFGPAQNEGPMAPQGPITFYTDRPSFDAANPGLPIEDWEDFTNAIVGCDAPANNGTSCPGGYNVGDILPGLEIDCAMNSGPGLNGLVIIPSGFDGNPSIVFGSNFFADNTIINLSPAVAAVGFDVSCHFGSPSVDVQVFDGLGTLVASTTSACANAGTFLGMSSAAPEGIGSVHINDPTGVSVESVDDVAFGGAPGAPLPGQTCTGSGGTNCPGPITDMTTLVSTFDVSCELVEDINVGIDITHTWNSDLEVTLVSPMGTSVLMFADRCGSDDDVFAVVDDEGTDGTWGDVCPPTNTPIQRFTPSEGQFLSAIDGEIIGTGTWTLEVFDDAGGDTGTLNDWSLELSCGLSLPFSDGFESGDTSGWSSTVP